MIELKLRICLLIKRLFHGIRGILELLVDMECIVEKL